MDNTNKKIANLIDGDNAECNLIEKYISEAGRYGRVTVKEFMLIGLIIK